MPYYKNLDPGFLNSDLLFGGFDSTTTEKFYLLIKVHTTLTNHFIDQYAISLNVVNELIGYESITIEDITPYVASLNKSQQRIFDEINVEYNEIQIALQAMHKSIDYLAKEEIKHAEKTEPAPITKEAAAGQLSALPPEILDFIATRLPRKDKKSFALSSKLLSGIIQGEFVDTPYLLITRWGIVLNLTLLGFKPHHQEISEIINSATKKHPRHDPEKTFSILNAIQEKMEALHVSIFPEKATQRVQRINQRRLILEINKEILRLQDENKDKAKANAKANAIETALARASIKKDTFANLNNFLDYKEEGKSSLREALAKNRGLFKPTSLKNIEKFINELNKQQESAVKKNLGKK